MKTPVNLSHCNYTTLFIILIQLLKKLITANIVFICAVSMEHKRIHKQTTNNNLNFVYELLFFFWCCYSSTKKLVVVESIIHNIIILIIVVMSSV